MFVIDSNLVSRTLFPGFEDGKAPWGQGWINCYLKDSAFTAIKRDAKF